MAHQIPYPTILKSFRQRYNEKEVLSNVMDQLPMYSPHLNTATTCLSIGTGYGDYDIEFIKRCLPNLKRFIVVEKDADCVKELKINLDNSFQDKLQVEIYEMSIEKFMDLYQGIDDVRYSGNHKAQTNSLVVSNFKNLKDRIDGRIDVVLALHVLYFLNEVNRKRLYNICFNQWLNSKNGRLIFCNFNETNAIAQLYNKLVNNVGCVASSNTIKNELQEDGIVVKNFTYNVSINVKEYDVDLYRMFNSASKNLHINEKHIQKALNALTPGDWAINESDLCVCEKKFCKSF